jgi:hypothetical protein
MTVSTFTVMLLAAFVWYSGGIALVLKGMSLARSAYAIDPDSFWSFGAPLLGIAIGLVKARFIFNHACKKNILRIGKLEAPKLWQCFRPGMLIFLAIIIPTGAWMSRAAAGKFLYLCLVCGLDFSIATGLLVSSILFWKMKAFSKAPESGIVTPAKETMP